MVVLADCVADLLPICCRFVAVLAAAIVVSAGRGSLTRLEVRLSGGSGDEWRFAAVAVFGTIVLPAIGQVVAGGWPVGGQRLQQWRGGATALRHACQYTAMCAGWRAVTDRQAWPEMWPEIW